MAATRRPATTKARPASGKDASGIPAGAPFTQDDYLRLKIAQADPYGWVRDHLGTLLSPNGRQIAEAVRDHPRVAVKAAHSISKSFSAARICIWWLHAYPGSVVLTTAPTFNQVANILWREVGSAYDGAIRPLQGRLLAGTQVQIGPKWYGLGFKSSDKEGSRFQGFHAPYLLVIVDEANGVSRTAIESLVSTLSSGHTRLLLIGNPVAPEGEFFEAFTSKAHLYRTLTISAFDTPNFVLAGIRDLDDVMAMSAAELARAERFPFLTTPRWVREVVAEHGADSQYVASRVLAVFPSSTPDALIPLGLVERAFRGGEDDEGRPLQGDDAFPIEAGLDIADAGLGADETVLAIRQGPLALAEHAWNGRDPMESVAYAAHLLAPYGPKVKAVRVDVIGIGSGPFARMRELGLPVVAVDVREATLAEKGDHPNRRAELWWGLRQRLANGSILVTRDAHGKAAWSERTVGQMTSIKAKWRTGYRYPDVERKEELRARGLRSPDRAEAWMFAYAGGLGYGTTTTPVVVSTSPVGEGLTAEGRPIW